MHLLLVLPGDSLLQFRRVYNVVPNKEPMSISFLGNTDYCSSCGILMLGLLGTAWQCLERCLTGRLYAQSLMTKAALAARSGNFPHAVPYLLNRNPKPQTLNLKPFTLKPA